MEQMEQKEQKKDEGLFKMIQTEDGDVPFLRDIWSFFGAKGVKTQFYSVNPDLSYKVDVEIVESLGCPVRILTDKEAVEQKWETIRTVVKDRKISEENKEKEWLQGMERKWILPKNIVVKKTSLGWTTLVTEVQSQPENRCDLLKIEAKNEEEQPILYSMINAGFRPGILLVRYTEDPDTNVPSMLIAGHLQMLGYKLVSLSGNWFLYVYADLCLYDSCSWRNTKDQNPVVRYLAELFQENGKAKAQAQPEENQKSQ